MKGLDLRQVGTRTKLRFVDIAFPIMGLASTYYWIVTQDTLAYRSPDGDTLEDDRLDRLILFSYDQWWVLRSEFMGNYAKFVINDWCHILGVRPSVDFRSAPEINKRFIDNSVGVYFVCVDGDFWLVLSGEEGILAAVRRAFPLAEECMKGQMESLTFYHE